MPSIYHFHVSGDKVSVHAKGAYWTDDEEVSEFDCFCFLVSPTEEVALLQRRVIFNNGFLRHTMEKVLSDRATFDRFKFSKAGEHKW